MPKHRAFFMVPTDYIYILYFTVEAINLIRKILIFFRVPRVHQSIQAS